MNEKDIRTLDNWYLDANEFSDSQFRLHGDVTGDPRFMNGLHIYTSFITDAKFTGDKLLCTTESGTVYDVSLSGLCMMHADDTVRYLDSLAKLFNLPADISQTVLDCTSARIESYRKEANNLLCPGELYIALYQSSIVCAYYCRNDVEHKGDIVEAKFSSPYYGGTRHDTTVHFAFNLHFDDVDDENSADVWLFMLLCQHKSKDFHYLSISDAGNISGIRLRGQMGKNCMIRKSDGSDMQVASSSFNNLKIDELISRSSWVL